jgi:hypothetical protein
MGLTPTNEIPGGRTLIVLEEDVYAIRGEVPATVTHRISATFTPAGPDENAFALAAQTWPPTRSATGSCAYRT